MNEQHIKILYLIAIKHFLNKEYILNQDYNNIYTWTNNVIKTMSEKEKNIIISNIIEHNKSDTPFWKNIIKIFKGDEKLIC